MPLVQVGGPCKVTKVTGRERRVLQLCLLLPVIFRVWNQECHSALRTAENPVGGGGVGRGLQVAGGGAPTWSPASPPTLSPPSYLPEGQESSNLSSVPFLMFLQ